MKSNPTTFLAEFAQSGIGRLRGVLLILFSVSSSLSLAAEDALHEIPALPPEIPELLTPTTEEIPTNFSLVDDAEILEVMGMERNPGYITNRSETAALAKRGALCSFAAVYKDEAGVALIVNGIYFRDTEDFETFWKDQREKELRIVAFEGADPSGHWLVLLGCDPEREYTEAEVKKIREGMTLYRDRLELKPLFNTFTLAPKPAA
tara:strand:- start:3503 stop:4120 length:618 start_codon:yes stop_codon:yes gene_type:complete